MINKLFIVLLLTGGLLAGQTAGANSDESLRAEVSQLAKRLAEQQKQIEELRQLIQQQQSALTAALGMRPDAPSKETEAPVVAAAVIPAAAVTAREPQPAEMDLRKPVEELSRGLAGFRFSGDFRYRLDVQARSGNEYAAPLQNIRSRYRLRLNLDKDLDKRFAFRMQLATGAINNPATFDQDMAAMNARHPFAISEAYIDFHPSSWFSMRGGRMEEIFADNSRFLWDDDVRFNGFHQILRVPLGSETPLFQQLEFRAGEYILSNPAVYVLPANSPFAAAGYAQGQKVRDANLFHPGFVLQGNIGTRWAHRATADVSVYRNPNQIQLASTAAGFPVLISNGLGLQLSGPMGGTGNATTQPGGVIFDAADFQIVRLAYRFERKGIAFGRREMPAWIDLQASRNVGAGRLRDAVMATANLGAVRQFGDLRFLYQFAIKDANAMISQFTDDDLGTGSGVNIRTHGLRLDLGLTRFMQWQNLVFLQSQRRGSNPSERFFVPLPHGANGTVRYQSQLAFSF